MLQFFNTKPTYGDLIAEVGTIQKGLNYLKLQISNIDLNKFQRDITPVKIGKLNNLICNYSCKCFIPYEI